jgi:hypothetical protein
MQQSIAKLEIVGIKRCTGHFFAGIYAGLALADGTGCFLRAGFFHKDWSSGKCEILGARFRRKVRG